MKKVIPQNKPIILKTTLENKVFPFFAVFFFLSFQILAHLSPWTETEIYPVHSSRYLFSENMLDFLFSLKPLFYITLYLSSFFSDTLSLLPMTGARFLFALNGLGILALMYFYVKQKTNKYNALLAVLLFASASIFLDRGFRVRSDLLTTSFSLIALLLTYSIKERRDYWKFYLLIPLLFSTLLISPKAIYWFLFTSFLILHDLKDKAPSRWLVVKTLFAVYMGFYFSSFLFKDPFFIKSIYQSAKFYLSNINITSHFVLEQGWIKSLSHISHIALFVKRNLFVVLIIILKFLFVIYSTTLSKKRKWNLSDLFFLTLLLVLLIHPQQKLFFLCAMTPFLFISFFTDQQWKQIIDYKYSVKFKNILLAGAFLYSFSYSSYFTFKIHRQKNNRLQKTLVEKLNTFYKNTNSRISIFDPYCLVYSRKTSCKYILSGNWTKIFKLYLKKHNFDVILASRHLDLFELTRYRRFPSFQYINVKNHIYYKAFVVKPIHFTEIAEDEDNARQTWQKNTEPTMTGKKGTQLQKTESKEQKTVFLRGTKALPFLLSSLETKVPEKSRKYSYLFLDSLNKPIDKTTKCQIKKEKSFVLQEACFYTKEDFEKGLIPIKKGKLALFYLPFPLNMSKELSLRALFRYDIF